MVNSPKTIYRCKFTNSNTAVTNTNTLSEGTHVIKCTATKTNGTTANATMTIVVESMLAEEEITLMNYEHNSKLGTDETKEIIIPQGVYVIKFILRTGTKVKYQNAIYGTVASEKSGKEFYFQVEDGSTQTIYVKVISGDTIRLDFRSYPESYAEVCYSRSINTQTPDYDLTS